MKNLFIFVIAITILFAIENLEAQSDKTKISEKDSSECGTVPAIDQFIPVEKEPQVDIDLLQKSIIYPLQAHKLGIEGKVIIRVLISKSGKIIKTNIETTDSELFNQSAIDAIKLTKFSPAIQKGEAVCCWVSIPISYRLK